MSNNNNNSNNSNAASTAATPVSQTTTDSLSSSSLEIEIGQSTLCLSEQLKPFVPQNALPDVTQPNSPHIPELQLAICRKLRELLPNNKDLLHTAQTQHWIPILLSWLNLHDQPAVQVEALLALTNVAELCCAVSQPMSTAAAASSYSTAAAAAAAASSAAAVAAAAQAAVSAVKGNPNNTANPMGGSSAAAAAASLVGAGPTSWNEAVEAAASKYGVASSKFNPYLSAAAAAAAAGAAATTVTASAAPGSVPFPPLSFSQTLSAEAVAALDASLTQTILACNNTDKARLSAGGGTAGGIVPTTPAAAAAAATALSSWTMPPAPLFPTTTPTPTGGINFTSLAPPPGGAHTSVPSNAFLPPPTPVTAPNFPQQLSASSQHMLLRHADAIPTLIKLLDNPRREVYEQAAWIFGSIAAGDAPSSSSSSPSGGSSGGPSAGATSAAAAAVAAAAAAVNDHCDPGGTGMGGSKGTTKSVSARDVILAAGVMEKLILCLEQHPENLSLQRIGSWALSNLVDGIFQQQSQQQASQANSSSSTSNSQQLPSSNSTSASSNRSSSHGTTNTNKSSSATSNQGADGSGGMGASPPLSYSSTDEIKMQVLLPVLRRLLNMSDAEVLGYTCWALSHLCDGPSSHIAAVVTSPWTPAGKDGSASSSCGLVPRLVELLTHPSWRVTKPALRTIGNIVCAECGDEDQTDYTEVILECKAVPRLKQLVEHSNREIQKEACWTLSNIAAGTVDQIQAVIDSGAIPPLVRLVQDKKTDQEVRSEACWVVLNATSCGSDSQIEVLVDEGCVSVLGVLLSEVSMAMMALEGLERVLQVEETRGMRPAPLVTPDLIEKARESHNSSSVIKRADRIWKTHFVRCALCKQSYSRHRGEASFCEECKCHVCQGCNCTIYHLDYQEELWAATEEQSEAKKNAKKSKNKKKKAKKKAKQQQEEEKAAEEATATAAADELTGGDDELPPELATKSIGDKEDKNRASPSFDDEEDDNNVVDFVLYLQQTGSIIALAKLMDALEYGDEEELNDYERRMIREQKEMLREQATNSAH